MIEIIDARENPDKSAFDIHLIGHVALHTNKEIIQLAEQNNLTPELIAGKHFNYYSDALLTETYNEITTSEQPEAEFLIAYKKRSPIGFIHTKRELVHDAGTDIATVNIQSLCVTLIRKRIATQLADAALRQYNQELPLTFTVPWYNYPMRRWGESIGFKAGYTVSKPNDIPYVAESVGLARKDMRDLKPKR